MNPWMREIQTPELAEKLKNVPDSPGVYLLKAAKGRILYVGKAKSLKKRIRAYFTDSKDIKTRHLQARIGDLEVAALGVDRCAHQLRHPVGALRAPAVAVAALL